MLIINNVTNIYYPLTPMSFFAKQAPSLLDHLAHSQNVTIKHSESAEYTEPILSIELDALCHSLQARIS